MESDHRLWTRRRSSSPTTFARRFSFTELCERYGVSRETGYKLDRALPANRGPAGLEAAIATTAQ